MPLKVSDGMGAWIDDFKKSDAPQFKGKNPKERRDMAIAAYMKAKNESVDEAIDMSKVGTKSTIMHPITRVSKKVDKKDVKKHVDAGWMHMGPKRNRVTKGPYKVKEGAARDRLVKMVDKASGRTMADREADLKKATASRKAAEKDLANFKKQNEVLDVVRKFRKANESVDLNEEMTFRVDIEGLPAMFMQAAGPGALKQELRKIVKQPSMIKDVKRVTDAVVKRTFRLKAQGRDDDGDGEIDERTDQWYDNQPEWGTDLSTIRARKKTPGQ